MDEKLILDDLSEIVAIPSVYSAPTDGAPYGKECRRALEWFTEKAKAYGLRAENIDNACAYAEVGDPSLKECVGVLAHLDVVPAGNGWTTPPFKMVQDGGMLYGRGVGDDKGSVVVCLHALKELAETKAKLKRRVRLIVGADEERGSSCIRHYVEKGCEIPAMSFVPDSEFPVINSEKGIAHIKFIFDDKGIADNISDIKAAECANALPDRASAAIKKGGKLESAIAEACGGGATGKVFSVMPAAENIISLGARPEDFEIVNADGVVIAANGTAEHASTPEKGDSALWKLFGFLAAFADKIGSTHLKPIFENLCTPLASAKLGIYKEDEKSGDLTMCMSMTEIKDGKLSVLIDFRLPLGVTPESVAKKICEKLSCSAEIVDYHPNLYIDKDDPLIKALLKVYRDVTGDMTEPLKTGGGTYARELPNAVAFGCTPVDMDINMHRADEHFPVTQLFENYKIYLAAMKELADM